MTHAKGLLWLKPDQVDWMRGHLAIPNLLQLYMPRNPRHPEWAAQFNVRAFAHSQASAAYLIEDLRRRAAHVRQHELPLGY